MSGAIFIVSNLSIKKWLTKKETALAVTHLIHNQLKPFNLELKKKACLRYPQQIRKIIILWYIMLEKILNYYKLKVNKNKKNSIVFKRDNHLKFNIHP